MPNYSINHGGPENGGTRGFFDACNAGTLWPWDWSPELQWSCTVGWRDLVGSSATQAAVITIPSAGFVAGRITATFQGYNLSAPVAVPADAQPGEDEEQLAQNLANAINDLVATTLSGVVEIAGEEANTIGVVFVAGLPAGTLTVSFAPAQLTEITFGGTDLVAGDYTVSIGGVDVTIPRAAENVAAMAVLAESTIEALIATTLADVVISADDDGVDTNAIQLEPGLAAVTITTDVPPFPQAWDAVFSGTATDGDYDLIFAHSSLPAPVTVRVTRSTTPSTNSDLAGAMETAVEANAQLAALIASATASTATNEIRTFAGITGLTITAAAPSPGELNPTDVTDGPTLVVADATPAGPTPTVAYSSTIDLSALSAAGPFPSNVWRLEAAIEVDAAFGANRTITVGDAADPDGLLGSTPLTLNTTGRVLSVPADGQHADRHEPAFVPLATINLGASATLTAGEVVVQITYAHHPSAGA